MFMSEESLVAVTDTVNEGRIFVRSCVKHGRLTRNLEMTIAKGLGFCILASSPPKGRVLNVEVS